MPTPEEEPARNLDHEIREAEFRDAKKIADAEYERDFPDDDFIDRDSYYDGKIYGD